MDTNTLTLFGAPVTVVSPDTLLPEPAAYLYAAVWGAVGRLVLTPPASIELAERCGRVAAVRITPQAVVDPVMPLVLGPTPAGYWWAMRRYWRATLAAVSSQFPQAHRKAAERAARVVLRTLDGLALTPLEHAFAEAYLWGAFNGEATARLEAAR